MVAPWSTTQAPGRPVVAAVAGKPKAELVERMVRHLTVDSCSLSRAQKVSTALLERESIDAEEEAVASTAEVVGTFAVAGKKPVRRCKRSVGHMQLAPVAIHKEQVRFEVKSFAFDTAS